MEQTPKKRGRPRLFLTKEMVEERKLVKCLCNNSLQQLRENLHLDSSHGAGSSSANRVEAASDQPLVRGTSDDGHGCDVIDGMGSNRGEFPRRECETAVPGEDRQMCEADVSDEDHQSTDADGDGTASKVYNNLILDLGSQDHTCGFCKAHVWPAEFTGRWSNFFFDKGRVYNTIFAFCSFGGKVDDSVNRGKGPYVFRVSGQTYHNFGSLLPPDGCTPKFAQLYMYDGQEAIEHRINFPGNRDEIDPSIVAMLEEMLSRENALVGIFKQVRERFNDADRIPVRLRLFERRTTDGRFENTPTQNDYEFEGLVVDNDFANDRDIVVEDKILGLKHIDDLHPRFMSLQYPLLFPHGEDGYRIIIKHRGTQNYEDRRMSTVSQREHYLFRLQYRIDEGHTLVLGGRLVMQFIVDSWCSIERGRLLWFRTHQSIIRSDLYNNIVDSFRCGDSVATDVGKCGQTRDFTFELYGWI